MPLKHRFYFTDYNIIITYMCTYSIYGVFFVVDALCVIIMRTNGRSGCYAARVAMSWKQWHRGDQRGTYGWGGGWEENAFVDRVNPD